MDEHLQGISVSADVDEEFELYWEKEKRPELEKLAEEQKLDTLMAWF